MIISEAEKNRIRKLHRELFILKEHGIGMASVGSGFVNPQGGTGRVGKFLTRQTELAECGEDMDPMEENLAGYYDFGEQEISEEQNEDDIEETYDVNTIHPSQGEITQTPPQQQAPDGMDDEGPEEKGSRGMGMLE